MKLKDLPWEDYIPVAEYLLKEMIENDDRETTPEEFLEMELSEEIINMFGLEEE